MLKQQIDRDLKAALLAGDKILATTLRGLKSAILYEEVAKGLREEGLGDDQITAILVREAKKRLESAELYQKGGDEDRAQAELKEKSVIEDYLPKQLSDEELQAIIDTTVNDLGTTSMQAMGQVIAVVKQKTLGTAEGGRIAKFVKKRLA